MPAPIQPDSRYARAERKRLPDGTVILDPHSRRRLDVADFPDRVLHVTAQPGDTVFTLADRLYGSSRLYWVVCECIHQDNPFPPLTPGAQLVVIHPQALREGVLRGG
ncbi:MAG: hypothetical protein AAF471_07040 [Myxococcota bacterium]